MRAKLVGAAVCLIGLATPAAAQQPGWGGGWGPYSNFGGGWGGGGWGGGYGGGFGFPGMNAQNVMPNIYNPRNQPLSPYLNLLRGGNAGTNYYYGVRPGTVGGGAMFAAFRWHAVRADDGWHWVRNGGSSLGDCYADVRGWTANDWAARPRLAAAHPNRRCRRCSAAGIAHIH